MSNHNSSIRPCKYPDARILVIDDTDEFIKLINLILKQAGYHNIISISNPVEAADTIRSESPDVILLDYEMPELTGLDILKSIHAENPEEYLPILILTANDDLNIRTQCLDSGAQDFINKPFNKFDLLLKLNNVIHLTMIYKRLASENIQLGDKVRVQSSEISSERQSRQHAEEKLQYRMFHDNLTDLPNKMLFSQFLMKDIEYARRNKTHVGILVVVIENLREINYTLGHIRGDQVIRELTSRLTTSTRQVDTLHYRSAVQESEFLSRISGNSFAIIASNLQSPDDCLIIANRIRSKIEMPITLDEFSVTPQCFTGIVHYPEHGEDVDTLLKNADIAAYQAKNQRNSVVIYTADNEFTTDKLELAHDLKVAITAGKLELYLQPKISLKSHSIIGFECLLRWRHPEKGFIRPDIIVDVAENTGHISALTHWVISRAIATSQKMINEGYKLSLAINVTASDLLSPATFQHIIDELAAHTVPPELLTLEITEGTMVQDPEKAMQMITKYSELGLKLSIDDFGTGYSCLAYLHKLKVNELKIDRSFVMDLETNRDNQKIVQSIIDIAHHLNLSVVAEGIEEEIVYDRLTSYHCDVAQGFFMAKPMPFSEIFGFLNNYKNIR